MGNALIFAEYDDPGGPGKDVDYFRGLKLKWVERFLELIEDSNYGPPDLRKTKEADAERLSWRNYSRIFGIIKDQMENEKEQHKRTIWHPSSSGYIMRSGLLPDFEDIVEIDDPLKSKRKKKDPTTIPDDYTDDDGSDTESESEDENDEPESEAKGQSRKSSIFSKSDIESENDETIDGQSGDGGDGVKENKNETDTPKNKPRSKRRNSWVGPDHDKQKRDSLAHSKSGNEDDNIEGNYNEDEEMERHRKKWDSRTLSPIFFGYHLTTTDDLAKEIDAEKTKNAEAEQRAIERAKNTRAEMLDVIEKNAKTQEALRQKKIDEIDRRYAAASARREDELNSNQRDLPETAFKTFKRKWDSEYDAAEAAYQAEVGALRYSDHIKTEQENANLTKRRHEMEAFKDAEAQEMPAAERLEEISRIEISRWIEELDTRGTELENARKEYNEMRDEFEHMMIKNQGNTNKRNEKQLRELRSVVNHAEGLVREKQKQLEEALSGLEDAEALFDRAIRIKHQQDQLLPLFAKVSRESLPSSCRVDYFLCALAILMNGTYEQKFNFMFNLFNKSSNITGFHTSTDIYHVSVLFQESLYRLDFIGFQPRKEDISNMITRSFIDLGLKPGLDKDSDRLTQFEIRQMIMQMIGHSNLLGRTLGFRTNTHGKGALMSTFQLNKMSCLSLLLRGINSPSNAKYRAHYEMTKYWPERNPKAKQSVHERALGMGLDDPLQPDYSRYMAKEKKKYRSTIPPLDHKHLMRWKVNDDRVREESVVKIQAMVRAHKDRKMAELAARKQAFTDARNMATKEMKAKVVREFKKRESLTGVGKMKWDAQVRMRQAKLKANGQNINRGNTVMVMMEEGISKAKVDIDTRFNRLESQEDFSTIDFGYKESVYRKNIQVNEELFQAFNLREKSSVDQDSIEGMAPKIVAADEPVDDDFEDEDKAQEDDIQDDSNEPILGGIDLNRASKMIDGTYRWSVSSKGESQMEEDLRLFLMQPEPDILNLYYRLRALNNAFTVFKTQGFLAELPSKRLVLKYIETNSEDQLIKDLRMHFRFTREHSILAKCLKNLVATDFDRGLLSNDILELQNHIEVGLRKTVGERITKEIDMLEVDINRKLETNENMNRSNLVQMEYDRAQKYFMRFESEILEVLKVIDDQKVKQSRLMTSVLETERKFKAVRLLKSRLAGDKSGETDPDVILEERQNWVSRLKSALKIPEETSKDQEAKWSEVRTVCREFLDVATADAMILISEHFQPKYRKTIPVVEEIDVHGRGKTVGRGLEGKYYVYESHNIQYVVCEDYNGIFNGSDEQAAKAAGKERLGALEYLKTHTEKLNPGLVITVDYGGFRVLGFAKLPIQKVLFNEEGEIRRILEDQVHGLSESSDAFVNKNKVCANLLKKAAMRLNLSEHLVKGLGDSHGAATCASSELKVYVGIDDEYYMKDFWRSFPPEHPDATPHLPRTSRDQSIFWRQLRPEFCRRYDGGKLSPDALVMSSYKCEDAVKQENDVLHATMHLVDTVIPGFAENISRRDYLLPLYDGLGLDLTSEMHSRGINMRHLGLLRSLLWRQLPGTFGIFFSEKALRTTSDMFYEVRDNETIRLAGMQFTIVVNEISITHTRLPITSTYSGTSIKGERAMCGMIKSDKNAEELRSVILGEMVARTVKNLIRLQLRSYARKTKIISSQMMIANVIEFLNIVTGSHADSAHGLQHVIYAGVRERFGDFAIRPSEKTNLHTKISPVILFTVKRILNMLGVQLNPNCLADFTERPECFYFCEADLLEVGAVIRHNIPIMTFSEAALVTLKANQASEFTYLNTVMADKPQLFYKMYERKGSRSADNYGELGKKVDGMYSRGCDLWHPGPIVSDPFSRCVSFSPEGQSYLDCKFDPIVVPQKFYDPFTIELFTRVTGGPDTLRVIFMCGRYGLVVNREGYYCFIFIDGLSEINIKICLAVIDRFDHIILTYDGTTLKVFVNSEIQIQTEVEHSMRLRLEVFEGEIREKREVIASKEKEEKSAIKAASQKQAESFFLGKEGISMLKSETQEIMETAEFQALQIGKNAESEQAAMKEKRTVALKQAKTKYTADLYVKNVKDIKQRYRLMHDELDDKEHKQRDAASLRVRTPLRIGASPPNGNSFKAEDVFVGEISCFQIYKYALGLDRIRAHYSLAQTDRTRDSQRLHAMAAIKYEEALSMASDDILVLKGFANSIVEYLKIESNGSSKQGVSKGKLKVIQAIDKFKSIGVPEGIAAIFKALPVEAEYALLACRAFQAIKFLDRSFFMRHLNMTRKDLVHIPHGFALDHPGNPQEYIDAAAGIYSEVSRDHALSFSYGETDLSWISSITSSELIVALVRHARDDKSLKMLRVGELFKSVGRDKLSVTDDDVAVLTAYASLTIGYDLSGCHLLTDSSLSSLSRTKNIRVLSFENCSLITDVGVRYLQELAEKLEVLNFSGAVNVTDEGLAPLFNTCERLTSVSVSNCSQITFEVLHVLALKNKRLGSLHAAGTQISDSGLSLVCSALSEKHMVSLDISQCRDISDYGAISVGESCPALRYLNINGLSRISDKGARVICAKCWYLETLSMEDVFLLDDDAFRFDLSFDGRMAADENMLRNVITLNLRDCVNLTDNGIQGLAERCRKIETLIMRGCDKVTDAALKFMTIPYEYNFPMCDSIKTLDISYCASITADGILDILPQCGVLEDLRCSGIVSINDSFVQQMCLKCVTIQKLTMQKCVFISNAALCSIADYLWLESLDITGCRRITDDGLEVLTVSCNGIFKLVLKAVHKITSRTINSISRNCQQIQDVDVTDCPLIGEKSIQDLHAIWPHIRTKTDEFI